MTTAGAAAVVSEARAYPEDIAAALERLGIRRLVLGIHDASFPSLDEEETGRGSPYSRGAARFLRFVHELGFGAVQLGPPGRTSEVNPSPYDGTVFSRNPEDTLARHKVERAVSTRARTRREMIPEIEQLDLFVLGGGGILYDRDAGEYMREVFIANELNVPVILYAISAGPLTTEPARQAVRSALNVS